MKTLPINTTEIKAKKFSLKSDLIEKIRLFKVSFVLHTREILALENLVLIIIAVRMKLSLRNYKLIESN
jgi:hypothetical protein